MLPRAVAADLPALPHPAAAVERAAVVPGLVAAETSGLHRPRQLPGDAVRRRGVLAGALEHAGHHRLGTDRHRHCAGPRAAGQCRHPRARDLPHRDLPLLPADDGRRRHHLALDVR